MSEPSLWMPCPGEREKEGTRSQGCTEEKARGLVCFGESGEVVPHIIT